MTDDVEYKIARKKAQARLFSYSRRRTIKDLSVCVRRDCAFALELAIDREIYDHAVFGILQDIKAATKEALT